MILYAYLSLIGVYNIEHIASFVNSLFNIPIHRDFCPSVLAAPGIITIEQQGGSATYGSTISFRHVQAGDFSKNLQLNYTLSDVTTNTVDYTGIKQLIPEVVNAADYHIHILTILSNPATQVVTSTLQSHLSHIVGQVLISACRPSGQLIRVGDKVQNFAVFSDYPGEVLMADMHSMVGTNEYLKYLREYQIFRRHLLPVDKRALYDELVGQQKPLRIVCENPLAITGHPLCYTASNAFEFLSAALTTQAQKLNTDTMPASAVTLLNTYGMRGDFKAAHTAYEEKIVTLGYQTPKSKHENIYFSTPVWLHSTVDSEHCMSNMSFAAFIRVYQVGLHDKDHLLKLVPGDCSLLYKSSIVYAQNRSHVGYTQAVGTAVNDDASAGDSKHVRLLTQHVLVETEAILPAVVTGSSISGGLVTNLNITSSQIYVHHQLRQVLEYTSSINIYHLPDVHSYTIQFQGESFSLTMHDSRWVTKVIYVMILPNYNKHTTNPHAHKTWHKASFPNVVRMPDQITFDVPQNQVQHLSTLYDSLPIAPNQKFDETKGYVDPLADSITAIHGTMNTTAYTTTYLLDRHKFQAPVRKEFNRNWMSIHVAMPILTQISLRIQSFDIYRLAHPNVLARSCFFYSNDSISPEDSEVYAFPLSMQPFNEYTNSGGLNLSKYRDLIIDGTYNTATIAALQAKTSVTSGTLFMVAYAYNILVTTQRTQYRRFAN